MPLAYRPPGVSVRETLSPSISPLLAVPANICLVGLAQGHQVRTDQFYLSGTDPIAIPGVPADATLTQVVSVKDVLQPNRGATDQSGYVNTTDYTVQPSAHTITRQAAGDIEENRLVNVVYEFVASDYYNPIRLDNFGAIENRFGTSVTSDNKIGSALSYAAGLCFENGAGTVVLQPLLRRETPGDLTSAVRQPTEAEVASPVTWEDTLEHLRDIEDINVFIPIIGQSFSGIGDATELQILEQFQDHINWLKTEGRFAISIAGEDGAGSAAVSKETLRAHAGVLRSRYGGDLAQQSVLLSPAKFQRPFSNELKYIGGQYAAAAVAGMIASRPVEQPVTRDTVVGLAEVSEFRSKADKNADAAAGLLVLEQKGFAVQVRHAITTSNFSLDQRELSVVRGKHFLIQSIRDTIDSQIIGRIQSDFTAPLIVRTTVVAVLEEVKINGGIVDYSGVEARNKENDPTVIEVRFSYLPSFPVNNVDIIFSIDLTTGELTTGGDTQAQ